jgi:hypothetical protein
LHAQNGRVIKEVNAARFTKLGLKMPARAKSKLKITVKSLKNGFTLKELPITVERRKFGASKLKLISDGKRILKTILTTSLMR